MLKKLPLYLSLIICLLLSGCQQKKEQDLTLDQKIARSGIQMITVGKTTTLILPARQFFEPNTTTLNKTRFRQLKRIAALMDEYDDNPVIISGHTEILSSRRSADKTSQELADAVKAYMWSQGINLQRITTKAYGDRKPISDPKTLRGERDNRRVEIILYHRG